MHDIGLWRIIQVAGGEAEARVGRGPRDSADEPGDIMNRIAEDINQLGEAMADVADAFALQDSDPRSLAWLVVANE